MNEDLLFKLKGYLLLSEEGDMSYLGWLTIGA